MDPDSEQQPRQEDQAQPQPDLAQSDLPQPDLAQSTLAENSPPQDDLEPEHPAWIKPAWVLPICLLISICAVPVITPFPAVLFTFALGCQFIFMSFRSLVRIFTQEDKLVNLFRMILFFPSGLFFLFLALGWVSINFRAAPRSTTSRIKNDQRAIATALEAYYVDHNAYPADSLNPDENAWSNLAKKKTIIRRLPTFRMRHMSNLETLTTPVAYLTALLHDPGAPVKDAPFCYRVVMKTGWLVWSAGPDGVYDITEDNIEQIYDPTKTVPSLELIGLTYDPSNGTTSRGDVWRQKQ